MKKEWDKADRDLAFFQTLNHKRSLLVSFNISMITAKCCKPHSIGKTVLLPAISEVLSMVLHSEFESNPIEAPRLHQPGKTSVSYSYTLWSS